MGIGGSGGGIRGVALDGVPSVPLDEEWSVDGAKTFRNRRKKPSRSGSSVAMNRAASIAAALAGLLLDESGCSAPWSVVRTCVRTFGPSQITPRPWVVWNSDTGRLR